MIVVAGALALGLIAYGAEHVAYHEIQLAQNTPAAAPAKPEPAGPPSQHMQLQAQYLGPLKDTIVQRWRDPVDGTVCYIYLPIVVQHSAPTPTGFVQYGANNIGSISCIAPR